MNSATALQEKAVTLKYNVKKNKGKLTVSAAFLDTDTKEKFFGTIIFNGKPVYQYIYQ